MVVVDNPKLQVSDIEFSMPKPSYTINTLMYLKEEHPENEYVLIMGADNLKIFHKWKNYEQILEDYSIYVYSRPGVEIDDSHKNIQIIEGAPQMDISASFIRASIKSKKDVSYLMPEKVWQYIDKMNFYK